MWTAPFISDEEKEKEREDTRRRVARWRARQRDSGMVEVRVWVPEERAHEVQNFARSLSAVSRSPTELEEREYSQDELHKGIAKGRFFTDSSHVMASLSFTAPVSDMLSAYLAGEGWRPAGKSYWSTTGTLKALDAVLGTARNMGASVHLELAEPTRDPGGKA
ncbi:MAG TPA: hypothetical protein VM661_01920 [Candidatus Sulfotelmatobacter sp.]|jgi:hypothetical protein|nr:hypothetical protein [Candidatus Sulfotelmatobacter sp.]